MRNETLKTFAAPIFRSIKRKMPETYGIAVIDEKRAVAFSRPRKRYQKTNFPDCFFIMGRVDLLSPFVL